MAKPSLLILAAGMGSRFGGIKQIAPIGPSGETILDYTVFDAVRAGFSDIVFLIRRSIEDDFRQAVLSRLPPSINCRLAFQEPLSLVPPASVPQVGKRTKPWGTAHALLCARPCLDGPFAVVNADDYYGPDSFRKVYDFLASSGSSQGVAQWCMVAYLLKNTLSRFGSVSRGICAVDADGFLRSVVEQTALAFAEDGVVSTGPEAGHYSGEELVSMNLWGLSFEIFDLLRPLWDEFIEGECANPKAEFFLPAVIDRLVGLGHARVTVRSTTESWFGLTYPQDVENSRSSIADRIAQSMYRSPLWP